MAKTIPKDTTGLSIPYRVWWRIRYAILVFYGPATQTGMRDPHYRMRAERVAKVDAARAERGLLPLED